MTLPPINQIFKPAPIEINKEQAQAQQKVIESTLSELGLPVKVSNTFYGPRFTKFSLQAQEGASLKRLSQFEKDLAVALSGQLVEIEQPSQNNPAISIVVDRGENPHLSLRHILQSPTFNEFEGNLKVGLGVDTFGQVLTVDLATLPHLLIGGTTGSGKSVCLNAIIAGLLCTYPPHTLNFIMIDPNGTELHSYAGLPHLVMPVVSQSAHALKVLKGVTREINRRYEEMARLKVRNIEGYNSKVAQQGAKTLPYLVIAIDNLLDLLLSAPKELEQTISQIAQKARGAGIHLIMVTLRSSVDAVSGAIKANFPGRIALRTLERTDSQLIIDVSGAEQLMGQGDMLFKSQEIPLRRLQGAYVRDDEISQIVAFWTK